ncbi:MAG: nucleoside monophosphate kinase [Bacteroidales bacterium]
MFNLVILGPPGSGKGKHSASLADYYGLIHLSSGELFRDEVYRQTNIGKLAEEYIIRGKLVPDTHTLRFMYNHIINYLASPAIIFDGFPRTLKQAFLMDSLMKKKGMNVKLVIGIHTSGEELLNRLRRRRKNIDRFDDKTAIIKKRMLIFKEKTFPVTEYYRQQGKYEEVSGMGDPETVFRRICLLVDQYKAHKHIL